MPQQKSALSALIVQHMHGRTYEDVATASGVGRGTINNMALGRTQKPYPDNLRSLAEVFGDGNEEKARRIYADLMEAVGYLDFMPMKNDTLEDENDSVPLEVLRDIKANDPVVYYQYLEDRLGPGWKEIVADVAEMRGSFDKADRAG